MKKNPRQHLRYGKQKQILHLYVRWMYELLADGRYYDLPQSKRLKELPEKGTYRRINMPISHVHQDDADIIRVPYFERMYNCGDRLKGYYNPETKELITTKGWFCNGAFCPVCEVKRAIREYSKLMYRVEKLGDEYEYYMLTLTLPNNEDGFGDELKLYKKCLKDLLFQFGFKEDKSGVQESICVGAYGSYEITKSDKGWHPHLHLLLAYPKKFVKDYQDHLWISRTGKEVYFCDNFEVHGERRAIKLNYDSIVQLWIKYVTKNTDKYNERLEDLNWLDVNFVKVRDLDGGINELAKYLIDFTQIESADDLFIYMRDSYGTKQRVQRGCFRMTPEAKKEYAERMAERHRQENANFIQSEEVVPCAVIWNWNYYVILYDKLVEEPVPYTSSNRLVHKIIRVKLE